MVTWVIASGNKGKIRELVQAFSHLPVQWKTQAELGIEEAEEPALTFVENALLKARHVVRESGLPALADDSGLVIDALSGRPGVHSARYALGGDAANIKKVLAELEGIPSHQRTARFVAALVWLQAPDDPLPIIAEGIWEGRIALSPQGERGFGYDPIFIPESMDCTVAQMPLADKQLCSHRGQAIERLSKRLALYC